MNIRVGAGILVSILAVSCAPREAVPHAAESAYARPLVVMVRADGCAACRRIEPVVRYVEEELRDRATFVYLDVTNEATEAEAARSATELGIDGFYAANGGQPGVVFVFGRDRRSPVRVRGLQVDPYRRAIDDAARSYDGPADR